MLRGIGTGVLVLALASSAEAGEILFTNGNRLAGEIASPVLLVSTGSGLVEVAPAEVAVLTPQEIRLKDGRVIRGSLVGGQLRTRTALGELAVNVDQLRMFRAADEAMPPPAPAPGPASSVAPAGTPPSPVVATRPSTTGPSITTERRPAASSGPSQVAEGARSIGRGMERTAKGVGTTVVDGADRIHDGFKLVGVTIWDGMKSVGRAVQRVFGFD